MNQRTAPEVQAEISATTLRANLQDVFKAMENQRICAIKAFWITLGKSLVLLPVCLLPGLLLAPSGDAIAFFDVMLALSKPLELSLDAEANLGIALAIVAGTWFFGGLVLLSRYFVRRGRQPGWDYLRDYKQNVFARVCKLHFDELTYVPNDGIGWQTFDDTKLFPWVSDWYRSDDYFKGRVGETDIAFAEATAKRERKRLAKGGYETYLDTYFRGIIFVADFHKHFHSTTRIVPAGEKIKAVRQQKEVVLEDPEFQANFMTTSTDQIDARYILSTSMLRRLLKVNQRFKNLRVLFEGAQMILLLPTARDRFEPSLHRRADSMSQVTAFIADIETVLPIVEDLNLNLRIWSKD